MMETVLGLLSCFLFVGYFASAQEDLISDLTQAQRFLDEINALLQVENAKYVEAAWNYNTNITEKNKKIMLEEQLHITLLGQEIARNASRYNLDVMVNRPLMQREFIKLRDIGTAAQTDQAKIVRLNEVVAEMETIYSTAKVCLSTTGNCHPLDPDLTNLLTSSQNYDELLEVWKGWRDESGAKMKSLYQEFVSLSNEAIRIAGHADLGAYWRSWYDSPEFEDEVRALFDQLRPLYEHLHAYVRRKLRAKYGAENFPPTGQIPAHLLGNMWAQQWSALVDDLTPYKGKPSLDVTDEMVRQGYTPARIFQEADLFFRSLGMIPMPQEFWDHSMLEKPEGREVVCHASAWDFYNGVDFRVKQCTDVTQDHFETAHHEMGHVQYFLQYKDQPISFRDGSNPGFHEAVGDVMSLSAGTLEHMHSIGLLPSISYDIESDTNFLLSMALNKIAFLPFGYLIDQWRWSVFRGTTPPEKYNEYWWQLRCRYQGISPPIQRTEADFDPGAKYHIPANTPYIRYFVSFVIQFQFHKALCDVSGYTGPLHRCDIYNSKEAGTALSNMLKLGSSQPWPVAMSMLTNQTKMDAQPLMDYFKPLLEFLRAENENDYGWDPQCPHSSFFDAGVNLRSGNMMLVLPILLFICHFVKH